MARARRGFAGDGAGHRAGDAPSDGLSDAGPLLTSSCARPTFPSFAGYRKQVPVSASSLVLIIGVLLVLTGAVATFVLVSSLKNAEQRVMAVKITGGLTVVGAVLLGIGLVLSGR